LQSSRAEAGKHLRVRVFVESSASSSGMGSSDSALSAADRCTMRFRSLRLLFLAEFADDEDEIEDIEDGFSEEVDDNEDIEDGFNKEVDTDDRDEIEDGLYGRQRSSTISWVSVVLSAKVTFRRGIGLDTCVAVAVAGIASDSN